MCDLVIYIDGVFDACSHYVDETALGCDCERRKHTRQLVHILQRSGVDEHEDGKSTNTQQQHLQLRVHEHENPKMK